MKWQPIETAPKDGTVIIGRNKLAVFACRYWTAEQIAEVENEPAENFRADWYEQEDEAMSVHPLEWIPMPEDS